MKHIKLIVLSLSFVVVSALTFTGVTSAQSFKSGDTVTVPTGEIVDSLLFAGGNTIDIAGTVNGDVYCGGQNVTISGTVKGDVICAGQTVNVSGKIEGNARLAGQSVIISGTIDGSATVATQTLTLEKNGNIQRDLVGGTQSATLSGVIGRDLAVGASSVTINGQVGRNVTGEIETLALGSTGRIGGDLRYISDTSPVVSSGGQVAGTVTRTVLERPQSKASASSFAVTIWSLVYVFIAMLVVALVLVLLVPTVFQRLSSIALSSPGRVVLTGLVGVIVVPTLIVLLFISTIGLPLGILALLIWCVAVMLSGPFVGYTVGRLILKNQKRPILIMLMGTSVLLIIYFIPILGFFAVIAAYVFGTGMLLDEAIRRLSRPGKKIA